MKKTSIVIDGVEYIRKDSVPTMASYDKMPYVIIRTYSAGVHAGYLAKKEGGEVVLQNSRRIWHWEGAASLSQFAMEGVKKPEGCRFAMAVTEITLQWIEIIPCTEAAMKSIQEVAIWKA